MVEKLIWEGTFGGRFADRTRAIEMFAEHNAEVQRCVAGDRLLVYQVDQGWEPAVRSPRDREGTVHFYERYGFSVTHPIALTSGTTLYGMWRTGTAAGISRR